LTCSAKCRTAKARGAPIRVDEPAEGREPRVRRRVEAELEDAGRSGTWLAEAAIEVARRIDEATAVMGYAALVKELRATMDVALEGVKRKTDPLVALQDELEARRERRRAG
jgi:hypothetical protein